MANLPMRGSLVTCTIAACLWLAAAPALALARDLPRMSWLTASSAPTPESTLPPDLDLLLPSFDYTATFLAPESDGALRAEETGRIHLDLRNLEERSMTGIKVAFKALAPVPGLPQSGDVAVPAMAAQATASLDIILPSDQRLMTQTAEYVLEIHAAGGYFGSPARLAFQTLAFVPPRLDLVGVDIRSSGQRRTPLPITRIPMGQRVDLVAQIENLGGTAHDVRARFESSDPAVILSSTASIPVGDLGRGQTRKATIEVEVPPSYQGAPELPVWIDVSERHADLGFRERLPLPLDEPASASIVPLQGDATPAPDPVSVPARNNHVLDLVSGQG